MIKKWLYNLYLLYLFSSKSRKRYFMGAEKSSFRIAVDLIYWMIKERSFNSMYFAFGLNLKNTTASDFIGPKEFLRYKSGVEKHLKKLSGCEELNYDVVTKDKFYSAAIFNANHLNTAKSLALIHNLKMISLETGNPEPLDSIFKFDLPIFIKNTVLEYNEGILKCEQIGGNLIVNGRNITRSEFFGMLSNRQWIVQKIYRSHPQIAKINDSALNSTRIVTMLNAIREPEYLAGFQAFAVDSELSDSWGKGAIYVGIDPGQNRLKKWGYYHPSIGSGTITDIHPGTGVVFQDYKIDELGNAVRLCIKAHQLLYNHFIIGWDIAITADGPMILEANEKPGMNAVQCTDGGLRIKILEAGTSILKI